MRPRVTALAVLEILHAHWRTNERLSTENATLREEEAVLRSLLPCDPSHRVEGLGEVEESRRQGNDTVHDDDNSVS